MCPSVIALPSRYGNASTTVFESTEFAFLESGGSAVATHISVTSDDTDPKDQQSLGLAAMEAGEHAVVTTPVPSDEPDPQSAAGYCGM